MTEIELLAMIANDVRMIMCIVIVNYASSCLRGWRERVVKGVR